MSTVLHISTTENVGGSGRSAFRIHNAVRALGWRSRMLVSLRSSSDPEVDLIWRSLSWRAADWIARRITERLSLQYLFYPSSFHLLTHPWFREADVVQLYNTHGSYFSHSALVPISSRKPVVWRLSDMWPLTGHCAYSFDCARWKTGCGACPIVHDEPALRTDRTALLWRAKRSIYQRTRMTIVAPSKWIASLVHESPLLRHCDVHVIPNGVDLQVFQPRPRAVAREALGLPAHVPIVLFSAIELNAARKGGPLLVKALEILKARGAAVHVVVAGAGGEQWRQRCGLPVSTLGTISDNRVMSLAYSAADVFVLPTLAENLPNGILESMACGTPVVAFDVGGVPEVVRSGENGYLARAGDSEDLAARIGALLDDVCARDRMGRAARSLIEVEHGDVLEARRLTTLYQELLRERSALPVAS